MRTLTLAFFAVLATTVAAQSGLSRLGQGLSLDIETTTTIANGNYSPLWLTANRHGLGSVETAWNYERVSLHRHTSVDASRQWRIGYGADVAVMFGGEQKVCLQELYVEAAWKRLYATIGSKCHDLPLKNDRLSSGGFIYGINARPIPQVRVGADYFDFPWTGGWWQWKGHVSFGMKTDGGWQKSHLDRHGLLNDPTKWRRRTENSLYHEKAAYWKFGKESVFPLCFEIGLQWVTEFGGTAYSFDTRNNALSATAGGVKLASGLDAFWHALIPGGVGVGDGDRPNVDGNHLGSWNLALTYKLDGWLARAYAERLFEDFSQLGTRYGISDHLFGLELGFPANPFVSGIVVEHINTRDQSGAVFHDVTATIPDQMDGRDNYYNHTIYTGYQNYGMGMGTPLVTAPLYNKALGNDGLIYFFNNRVRSWHIGLAGSPVEGLEWRLLMTFSRNWGTYMFPFADPADQTYMALEASYAPKRWNGWSGRIAVGHDHGDMLGNSTGCQLTVCKNLKF